MDLALFEFCIAHFIYWMVFLHSCTCFRNFFCILLFWLIVSVEICRTRYERKASKLNDTTSKKLQPPWPLRVCFWWLLYVFHNLFFLDFQFWLIETNFPFCWSGFYPPVEQIVEQCGKFRLLDKLLNKLLARKHKVCLLTCP